MNNYQVLLGKINEYLKRDDVISNSDVISAYDLFKIANEEIGNFNQVSKIIEELAVKIKDNNLLFSNAISKLYKSNKLLNYTIDVSDSININLRYEHGKISIKKNLYSCDIKFSKKSLKCLFFTADYRKLLFPIFDTIEEYKYLFKGTIASYDEMVSDDLFILNLDYAPYFCINSGLHSFININPDVDNSNVFKKYFKDLPSLYEIVKAHKMDILKKMPVNVSELNPISQEFVKKRYCKYKTKTLTNK